LYRYCPDASRGGEFYEPDLFTAQARQAFTQGDFYGGVNGPNRHSHMTANMVRTAMVYANQAILRETAAATATGASREIHSAPGLVIYHVDISLGALIAISVLVALQAAALVALVVFAMLEPTWMAELDSLAMIILGSQILLEEVLRADGWITGPVAERTQLRRRLKKH